MIEARLTDTLSLALYDTDQGEWIKSFPSKGVDPKKREKAVEQFCLLRKQVHEKIKQEVNALKKQYVSGNRKNKEIWINEYQNNAIKEKIAQLLVWGQKNGETITYFTLRNGKPILSDFTDHVLNHHDIFLAHPIEMNKQEISDWENYFSTAGLKQPFSQIMYEPIIHWEKKDLSLRYDGTVIPGKERNAMKKALHERGVQVKSGEVNRTYNHRTGKYEFGDANTMFFGNSLSIEYRVNEKTLEITLGRCSLNPNYSLREMNTILKEVDKAAIASLIIHDIDDALIDENLSQFTVAQISEFIELSTKYNSHRWTARLLDYKHKTFPLSDSITEYTLDF